MFAQPTGSSPPGSFWAASGQNVRSARKKPKSREKPKLRLPNKTRRYGPGRRVSGKRRSPSDAKRKALNFAREYAGSFTEVLETGRCGIFVGKPGTGKTHLAVAVGLHAMRAGHAVLFSTVMRAIRRVKDSWSRDSRETETQAVAGLVFPDLLILDEVGVQFGSETERLILFDVLNERYEKRKPTLLLSNLNIDEVKGFLGERIFDRLREDGGRAVVFDWESHRGRS